MGKGSKRRPRLCTQAEYEDRYNEIFGKQKHWWDNEDREKWTVQSKKEKLKNQN